MTIERHYRTISVHTFSQILTHQGMAQRCVHKGCGKIFTDPKEECSFHPGPPIFHEGQKGVCAPAQWPVHNFRTLADSYDSGWKCCKPRVLTFEEFLSLPPCTTGKHSTIDDTPRPDSPSSSAVPEDVPSPPKPIATNGNPLHVPTSQTFHPVPLATLSPPPPESDSDDPSILVPANTICRRRGCDATSPLESPLSRGDVECVHHPGQALFHEGSKGWTCCKRRVLEFDEFMKIEGCKRKKNHLFVGSKKQSAQEEAISKVRYVSMLYSRDLFRNEV